MDGTMMAATTRWVSASTSVLSVVASARTSGAVSAAVTTVKVRRGLPQQRGEADAEGGTHDDDMAKPRIGISSPSTATGMSPAQATATASTPR
jgi:hypothetical protein